MKLKIKVTKEILRKSMMCGTTPDELIITNCAVALAVREIWPDARLTNEKLVIERGNKNIILLPESAGKFISDFDMLSDTPKQRLNLPELEFEVEIDPDVHLKHIEWYKELINNSLTLELC